MRGRLDSWLWWMAYSLFVLPVGVLSALAWGLPLEVIPVLFASAAGFRLADVVTEWLHKRGHH